ncbi:MAG: hypothetical protein LBP59_00830 [Planctomycetaceae bacterium]|jgi:hypothetical protein|nr:hypothetical protein [Planctomycetaceae bacterium]
MTFAPPNPDWKWFGSLSTQDVEKYTNSNPNITWLQNAKNWIKNRSAEGPPDGYVPVLTAAGRSGGQLGFITVDEKRTYGKSSNPSEFESHAYDAAKIVFDLFKPFNTSLGEPFVEIYLDLRGGGDSLSLPAVIAALGRLVGISLSDIFVSTGSLSGGNLKPVNADTLANKIEVAKRFGYKKLIVVKGQDGIIDIDGIEIIEVDVNPLSALFDIIELSTNQNDVGIGIARLLAAYGNRNIRNKLDKVESVVKPFLCNSNNIVRHIANDLLSRSALHNGATEKSAEYRKTAGALNWNEIPTDNLGHYMRYEQAASCSVLAVDCGEWHDDHFYHNEVDKRLSNLTQAIIGKFADADDYLSALTMLNTRALRRRFIARLNYGAKQSHAIALLKSAWNDLTFMINDWDKIWNYADKIYRYDTNFERQRNYCLECLADYKRIANGTSTMELVRINEFLNLLKYENKDNAIFTLKDGFDYIAWIQYQYIFNDKNKLSEDELAKFIDKVDATFEKWIAYPNFLAYEFLLRYKFVNGSQKEHCLSQLTRVNLDVEATSIETLLMLRTRQVLMDNGIKVADPVVPPEDAQLRKIYDDLVSNTNTLINRCPY